MDFQSDPTTIDPFAAEVLPQEEQEDQPGLFDDYWAAKSSEEIGNEVMDKVQAFDDLVQTNGIRDLWAKKYRYYYGRFMSDFAGDAAGLGRLGENGEYIFFAPNHLRSLIKGMHSMTVQNLPSFEVRSANNDSSAIRLAELGDNILEFYFRHKRVRMNLERSAEHALVFDAGYTTVEWDEQAGKEYGQVFDPDTGRLVAEGDLSVKNPLAPDVIFDPLREDYMSWDWVIVRDWVPRVDLQARYGHEVDLAAAIKNAESREKDYWDNSFKALLNLSGNGRKLNDDVCTFKLFHGKTEALPEGRLVVCLADGTVLFDSFLPYQKIPLIRMTAGEHIGTPFGYSPINDILAPQEAANVLFSTILTNQFAGGINVVAAPKGGDLNLQEFGRGMNVLRYSGQQPPEVLSLTKTAPEVFSFVDKIEKLMETLSGISEVSRGRTLSGSSGQGNALMASITAQNQSQLQNSYAEMCGAVATLMLGTLKDFANNARTLAIAGKSSGRILFQGQDLFDLESVYVDLGSPVMRTQAGRLQVAQDLLQTGNMTPADYFNVVTTGSLDIGTEKTQAEELWIRQENEILLSGQPVKVHPLDNHAKHIGDHVADLLNRREIRMPQSEQDLRAYQNIEQHIQEHLYHQESGAGAPGGPGAPPPGPGGPPPAEGPPQGPPPPKPDGGPGGRPALDPMNPEVQRAGSLGIDLPDVAQAPSTPM